MPTSTAQRCAEQLLDGLLAAPGRRDRVTHVEVVAARPAHSAPWPQWVSAQLRTAFIARGVEQPWSHQVAAAEHAHAGRHVVLSSGTASGKSLAFLLPALTAVLDGARMPSGRGATALYLAPTKALAHDQLASMQTLEIPQLRAATYDGDTPREERDWVRAHASYVLTNPDLLHRSLLPGHARWASFLRALRFVIVDECHVYRGVFGSHVAAVLRRLRRLAQAYGSDPVVIAASATVADPAAAVTRLVGMPVAAVTEDGSPHGRAVIALWEPPLTGLRGESGAPVRRTATAETADLLSDLVVDGVRTVAFVRSRRGAEAVAMTARDHLSEVDGSLAARVASYRAGYLPEERRRLEHRLRSGDLLGVAATTALELGIDVSGLDAVLIAGWPGRRSSFWQQIGRAGRRGADALAILVARDDPLDTYLVHHPEAIFGASVEATVLDPDNPYVLGPHLCAAAAERPLHEATLADWFGPGARAVVDDLTARGLLRRRPAGWFWTRSERASDLADLRGLGAGPVQVVESGTGRLLGTVDGAAADAAVHTGAVYVHQGRTYVIDALDLTASAALASAAVVDFSTHARSVSDIAVVTTDAVRQWGPARVHAGVVDVSSQVVSFLRRRLVSGEVLGEQPLDLPQRQLRTRACWWTVTAEQIEAAGLAEEDVAGAAHAAEHAAIGMLPLIATCDRWDIGGVSTAAHPDTGLCTVFVHDAHSGGAGFADRAFAAASVWLTATRDAIAACDCPHGCPSCIQSPKCGNGNEPLDKAGAVRLLDVLLIGADADAAPTALATVGVDDT